MSEETTVTPATPYKFSNEELRVLQQCNIESFYQRCLPMGTVFGIGTYYCVKGGLLQPNARFGAAPKVIGSVILGYILGKLSYQSKCAEKLMALPDSKLGAMLRNRKHKGGFQEALIMDSPGITKAFSDMPSSETYSDMPPSSHMDIDTDRPRTTMDDSYRPVLDDSGLHLEDDISLPPENPQTTTTYDELRRKNREEYALKKTKPYRGVLTPDEVPSALRSREPYTKPQGSESSPGGGYTRSTNKYGDIWDK